MLELGRDNFGVGRSCNSGWKPLAKYGVAEADLPVQSIWNCHGGTTFLIGGGGSGYAGQPALTDYALIGTTTQAVQGGAISLPPLQRGDVIVYYGHTIGIMHSQVVLSSSSTYSANNEQLPAPGLPDNQSWKWAESPPGLWATNTINHQQIRPITIKVYRKE